MWNKTAQKHGQDSVDHGQVLDFKNEKKVLNSLGNRFGDFPGSTEVKNPPASAGFEPWSGKIPHAAEQLSPCATTTEPGLQSPRATTTEASAPTAHAPQEKPPQ